MENIFNKRLFEKDYGCLNIIDVNGDWKKVKGLEYAVNRLITLLGILEGTYIEDPEFGIKLPLYIFEKFDENTIVEIEHEIRYKLEKYEKDLVLIDLKYYVDETKKQIIFKCILNYTPTNEQVEQIFKLDNGQGVLLPI